MTSPAIVVEPPLRTAVVLAVLYSAFVTALAVAPDRVVLSFIGEDGFVEITSALAYVVGVIVALVLARRTSGWSRAHWVMWAVFCVLFFGEETSWLQSWVGYETPQAVKEINKQGEFNLHNLLIASPEEEILGPGAPHFEWRYLRSAQLLFNVGFATYFLVLPLLMRLESVRTAARRFGFPVLAMRFVLMTWIPIVISAVLTYVCRSEAVRKALIAETRELFFALTICAFIALAYEFSAKARPTGRAGRRR